jgi:hypothetical protein
MKFDPTKAEAVEDDIFDKFMDQMNARSQTRHLQQVSDTLRVLLETTRQGSASVIDGYKEAFEDLLTTREQKLQANLLKTAEGLTDKLDENLKKHTAAIENSINKVVTRADAMSTSLGRVEKMVKDLASSPKGAEPDNATIRSILAEVSKLRTVVDNPQFDDRMGAVIDMISELKNLQSEAPPKKSWTFTVERDDFARIKNVTATSD